LGEKKKAPLTNSSDTKSCDNDRFKMKSRILEKSDKIIFVKTAVLPFNFAATLKDTDYTIELELGEGKTEK
jgi:S-adenosylmethionine:tRNA-ribosyltransferase-isomerase (queuine synthetase)